MNDKYKKNIRNFKGVWFPAELWFCERLNMTEKSLFAEIDSLDNETGCTASNSYLAFFVGVTSNRVSKLISKLKKLNLIKEIENYENKGKRILKSFPENLNKISVITKVLASTPSIIGANNNTLLAQTTIPSWRKQQPYNKEDILNYIKNCKQLPVSKKPVKISMDKIQLKISEGKTQYELAKLLYDKIVKLDPGIKEPNLSKWAKVFQTMNFVDGKNYEEIRGIIEWIFSKSKYWQDCITTPYQIKAKYSLLWRQKNRGKKTNNKNEFEEARRRFQEKNKNETK